MNSVSQQKTENKNQQTLWTLINAAAIIVPIFSVVVAMLLNDAEKDEQMRQVTAYLMVISVGLGLSVVVLMFKKAHTLTLAKKTLGIASIVIVLLSVLAIQALQAWSTYG